MANNLFITATEAKSGKSAIALCMMHLLLKNVRKAAFFRPIIHKPLQTSERDHDIHLILTHFGLDIPYEDTYAYTIQDAREMINKGQKETLLVDILDKYRHLESQYDFVLCEGTDYLTNDSAFEFDLNADIAANLGCPVMVVSNATYKGAREIVASTQATLDLLDEKGLNVVCCLINRSSVTEREESQIISSLHTRAGNNAEPLLTYVLPEEPTLGKPTMADVQKWLGAQVLYGHHRMDNLVQDYLIAAMQVGNFLDYIGPGSLVITPGDRADIILASLGSRFSTAYPDIAGMVLSGGLDLPLSIHRMLEGWKSVPIPIMLVSDHTFKTVQRLSYLYGRIEPTDSRKINSALGHFEAHVDTPEVAKRVIAMKSTKITPKMFEYKLLERAAKHRMRIVLAEGSEERILRATDILMRRNVADIILIGDVVQITDKIVDLGFDFNATIIQPDLHPNFPSYVQAYYEMRKSKGINMEQAKDTMSDATYFATMMVQMGDADGMVSGSINTTAHTIRPAFEFVRTKPGASIVSSVFFMCLKDRVLVFGDCAVNPNPTAEQLASIAISSAETAKIFGIDPRVAMLSYSTGSSGKGVDVDNVLEATRIARERAPELLLEGPLQYDAAIDLQVAQTKLPGSKVAGHATVFIFPDLNTGNNTYKAVQRAADAIAIGPVLQGLNKPVNDLSRGCTVPDIVNTVAITAIQAQAEKGYS